jgi:hypothetical protein
MRDTNAFHMTACVINYLNHERREKPEEPAPMPPQGVA